MSDYVIIGAGPTGCALGSYLARAGASVTLVEAVEHPESVVGESMLPWATQVFDELGFDTSGFMVKHGAVFCDPRGAVRFDFREAEDPRYPFAWQVQREIFDIRWRRLAESYGCKILYTKATGVSLPGVLHTEAGDVRGRTIVDAAGRDMWLSSRRNTRVGDTILRNSAVGTRMRNVRQLGLDQPGDITICCIPGGWIWIIPFGGGVASVGTVFSKHSQVRGNAEERFWAGIAQSADAQARLEGAERILPFRGVTDFTQTSTAFHGEGYILCGDAATFIDPVFSSGVLLGLHGARMLSHTLLGDGDLDAWTERYRQAAGIFRKAIDAWYDGAFMAVALAPPKLQKPYFRKGIVSLLAGDVYDPARKAPRWMADRMPQLAAALRRMPEVQASP